MYLTNYDWLAIHITSYHLFCFFGGVFSYAGKGKQWWNCLSFWQCKLVGNLPWRHCLSIQNHLLSYDSAICKHCRVLQTRKPGLLSRANSEMTPYLNYHKHYFLYYILLKKNSKFNVRQLIHWHLWCHRRLHNLSKAVNILALYFPEA